MESEKVGGILGAIVAAVAFVAMNTVASYAIFREGGYRGLLAAMAAISLAFPVAAVLRTVPIFKVISIGLSGMAVDSHLRRSAERHRDSGIFRWCLYGQSTHRG